MLSRGATSLPKRRFRLSGDKTAIREGQKHRRKIGPIEDC
jgi:hypothetical protein